MLIKKISLDFITKIVIGAFSSILLLYVLCGGYRYGEIDSNGLPLISLQYRMSYIVEPSDIDRAVKDMPQLYPSNIKSFDNLRSSKLIKLDDTHWLPYYLPIYPLLCLPAKLVLQAMDLEQARSFTLTNAILVILAALSIYKVLKVKASVKLALIFAIFVSPVFFYAQYINYEVFIFSLLTISYCFWYERKYKTAAFLLALTGMANPMTMAAGLLMIIDYFVQIVKKEQFPFDFKRFVRRNWLQTLLYAACFLPSFAYIFTIAKYQAGTATLNDYFKRFFAYLFDINLGFFSFAGIFLIIALLVIVVCLRKKDYRIIPFSVSFIAIVAAYSLMFHINSGMEYSSRYVFWSYPALVFFVIVFGAKNLKSIVIFTCTGASVVCAASLILINGGSTPYLNLNKTSQFILNNFPALYSPYEATFNSRVNHIDGAYFNEGMDDIVVYQDPRNDEVRKVLVYGSAESKNAFITKYKAIGKLSTDEMISKIKNDRKFHYLNFSPNGKTKVYKMSPVEQGLYSYGAVVAEINGSQFDSTDLDVKTRLFTTPIQIQSEKLYEVDIQLELQGEADYNSYNFVDFYGGTVYDSPNQDVANFLVKKRLDYTFYINSGSVASNLPNNQVTLRLAASNGLGIKHIRVTELEEK